MSRTAKVKDDVAGPVTFEKPDLFPNRIKCKVAFLHGAITWPSVGVGAEVTISQTKIPGVEIWLTPQGLLLEIPGKDTSCVVPLTNIRNIVLER